MHVVSTNFAKTLVYKREYDVILWRHKQRISSNKTTIRRCFILEFRRGASNQAVTGHHQTSARHYITGFGIALAEHCDLVFCSFVLRIDWLTPFLTEHAITCGVNGLNSFICLWCNTTIVTIGRKVRFHYKLPFTTKQRCSSAAATWRLHQKFGIVDISVATSDILTWHQIRGGSRVGDWGDRPLNSGACRNFSWVVLFSGIWWSFVFGVRCLWCHNLAS